MFNQAHETFIKDVSIKTDSMTVRFIKPDVAIATVFSTEGGAGIQTGVTDRLTTTMVIVKPNNK